MAERTYQQDRLDIQSYLNKTYKAEYYKDLLDEQEKPASSLYREALKVAKKISGELTKQFGAKRVVLFGSLSRRDFSSCSDIDLAVWGIPVDDFFRAVAFACGISDVWKVDVVDAQDCSDTLREVILKEGTEL